MRKYIVLTDSACDIPPDMAEKAGVEILNFSVQLDGRGYTERADFTPDQFYAMMDSASGVPTTSQIPPAVFSDRFSACDEAGVEELLYVSINSGGSATYENAVLAAQEYRQAHAESGMHITILDSHTYSMAYGRYVVRAAEKLASGAEMQDVVAYLNEKFAHVQVVISVHSLDVIRRSGRISAAAAFAGSLMGLRPVITIIQGATKVVQKVRGDSKVVPALAEHLARYASPHRAYMVGATKGMSDKNGDARTLAKLCEQKMGFPPECIFNLGASVTSNTGTDAIALVYLAE